MKKINLDALSGELQILPLVKQKKTKAGYNLPTVSCTTYSPPNERDWEDEIGNGGTPDYGDHDDDGNGQLPKDWDDKYVLGYPGANIEDSSGAVESFKAKITSQIEAIKGFLESGALSKHGITDATLKYQSEILQRCLVTVGHMETSDKYAFEIITGENLDNDAKSNEGYVIFNQDTGRFELHIEDANDVTMMAHELMHIGQLLTGDLWLEQTQNGLELIGGHSIEDEAEAYQLQHILTHGIEAGNKDLSGNLVPGGNYKVTVDEVLKHHPGMYDSIPRTDNEAGGASTSYGNYRDYNGLEGSNLGTFKPGPQP